MAHKGCERPIVGFSTHLSKDKFRTVVLNYYVHVLKDDNLQVRESLASELVRWVCGRLFMTQGTALAAVAPHPAHVPFLCAVLDLSLTLDPKVSVGLFS